MAKTKLLSVLGEGLSRNWLTRRVDQVNQYIEKAEQEDIYAVEPDSTWEENYEFEPIRLSERFLYVNYTEPSNRGKKVSDRYNIKNPSHEDDIRFVLSWIIRAIKKGYRSEGLPVPKL